MKSAMKIGWPLAALVLALSVVADGQVGLWRSTSTGLTTTGTVTTTNTGAGALAVSGGATFGNRIAVADGTSTFKAPSGIIAARIIGRTGDSQAQIDFVNENVSTQYAVIQSDTSGLLIVAPGAGSGSVRFGTRIASGSAQPGFLAYNSLIDSGLGASTQTVDFDTEVYDTGSNFAADTFTAPVTGIYQLCTHVKISAVGTSWSGTIVTSNRSYAFGFGTTPTFGAACVFADMDAADTAVVQVAFVGTPNAIDGGNGPVNTYFSGRLVP